jgi:hypothetical protein
VILQRHPDSGLWAFKGGRHQGETIEQVAASDPNYVRWAWGQEDLTDDAFYALSDCLDRFNIPRTKEKTP